MANQVHTNTFTGGLFQDNDVHIQKSDSYRDARNIRIRWNRASDSDLTDGKSFAVVNVRGNKLSFSLCDGYRFISSIETRNGSVIFSTNGVNSEIGYLMIGNNPLDTNFSSYYTLYNDKNDPNKDLLKLYLGNSITGFAVYENENTERVYWADGYNQKRTFNLNKFFIDGKTTTDCDSNISPIHVNQACNATNIYPKYLSVHSFDDRMDVVFPFVKFRERISGNLLSGTYELYCRYVSSNGHYSTFHKHTLRVFVTSKRLDGFIGSNGNAYKMNHHNRQMSPSGEITTEGIRWEVTDVDTRWDFIEFVYVYYETSKAPSQIYSFKKVAADSNIIYVDLKDNIGLPISAEKLTQKFSVASSVGVTNIMDNRTFDADVSFIPEIKIDTSTVTIKPILRNLVADITVEPKFGKVENVVTQRNDNDPLTNSNTTTTQINIQKYGNITETYEVVDDYLNYKGQQVENIFQGYWRGESYDYGLLPIDRKGNPLFVIPIKTFSFPNQYDSNESFSLTQLVDGLWNIRVMGAVFSGISLPIDVIFEHKINPITCVNENTGVLNISGIMIVRAERNKRVLHQGVVFPCVQTDNKATADTKDSRVVALPFATNNFGVDYSSNTTNTLGMEHDYFGTLIDNGQDNGGYNPALSYSNSHWLTYHSPDVLIEGSIVAPVDDIHKFKSVGIAHQAYSTPYIDLSGTGGTSKNHFYTKNYKTTNDFLLPNYKNLIPYGRPKLGEETRIETSILLNQGVNQPYKTFDPYNQYKIFFPNIDAYVGYYDTVTKYAHIEKNAALVKIKDFDSVDIIESDTNLCSYRIFNYEINPASVNYETLQYFSTGHYLPITQKVLDNATKVYDSNGVLSSYQFDNIEVWGGDCYVNLFDFTRLYPNFGGCDGSSLRDYALSHIIPIESNYNIALRYGRNFAQSATMPQAIACNVDTLNTQFSNGVMLQQPEDWNYNEVLTLHENIRFFQSKPKDYVIIDDVINGIMYSPQKLFGELDDSFRQNLAFDTTTIDGSFGRVMGLVKAFNYLYVIQERAFGYLLINQKIFVPSTEGQVMTTSGNIIGGVQYISRRHGTQHKKSIWFFDNFLGFVDARMGKMIYFSQAGMEKMSATNNLEDLVSKYTLLYDNKFKVSPDNTNDIISSIDYENEEVGMSFISSTLPSFTITFNKDLSYFTSKYDYTSKKFFNVNRFLFSSNPMKESDAYLHNYGKYGQFYGIFYKSYLMFIVNSSPNVAKIFHNGYININKEGVGRIGKIIHESPNETHTIYLNLDGIQSDDRWEFFEDSIQYPMHEIDDLAEMPALRGHYLIVKLFIDNDNQLIDDQDIQVAITSFDTKFEISNSNQYFE